MKTGFNFVEIKMSFHNLSISVLKVGRLVVAFAATAAFFGSCIPEDDLVEPHPTGNATTRTVSIGSNYEKQVFFNLETNKIISENSKFDWDLAFDCRLNADIVRLNQAKFMGAWLTPTTDFERLRDTVGFEAKKRTDATNLSDDSLSIGNIYKHDLSRTFLVFLGYDRQGDPIGFRKLQLTPSATNKYFVRHANLDNTDEQNFIIEKDSNFNFVYFSFKKNKTLRVEPPKKEWDISVTQYVHQFYTPYQAYLVTGVLLNPYRTQGVADSSKVLKFENLERRDAEKLPFRPQSDLIGYNWKEFLNNRYVVYSHYLYVVKTQQDYFYKLRFTSFYDDFGVKGSPKFEFQRL